MKEISVSRIMINGRACSGKDQISDYLVEKYGYTKVSFAQPIYDIARSIFGMTTKDRALLQSIGQKMREIDPDVWVRYLFKEALKLDKIVLSDVRQHNEYLHGLRNGFVPVNVYADLDVRIGRCRKRDGVEPDIWQWENESEVGADGFRYICIPNNGTLDELYKNVDALLQCKSWLLFEEYRKRLFAISN